MNGRLCPRDETCPSSRLHDTYVAYGRGCRSAAARDAAYRYRKQLRAGIATPRLVSSLGTRRRLQALHAIGWPWSKLVAETGIQRSWFGRTAWQIESAEIVTASRAAEITALYERLSMSPGPSKRTRNYARRYGWVGPLAWTNIEDPDETPDVGGDDDQPDENVIAAIVADRVTWTDLTAADREHLVGVLFARGWETAAIADRARGDVSEVRRVLDRLRARQRREAAA